MSAISGSTPSFASSAMREMTPSSPPLRTMNGSSVTTIAVRPLSSSSISARARTRIRPRPVTYASWMPDRPMMMPPVGKSGPGRCSIRSSTVASGLSISATTASMVSPRLCGGTFVAMPTAMPVEPFTSRFGNRDGSTSGICREPS